MNVLVTLFFVDKNYGLDIALGMIHVLNETLQYVPVASC